MERAITLSIDFKRQLDLRSMTFAYFRKTHIQVFRASFDKDMPRVAEVFSYPFDSSKTEAFVKKLKTYEIHSLDLILPREFFVSKRITLPASDFREARKMAVMKLPKLSPFPLEESVSEVTYAGKAEKNYIAVSLWIINKKLLYRYLYVLGQSGILVSSVRMDIDGLPFLLEKRRMTGRPCMVILFDKTYAHLSVLKDNFILNSRMVSLSSSKSSADSPEENLSLDSVKESLAQEAAKFISYNREEFPDEQPEKIFFFDEQAPFWETGESVEGIPLEKLRYRDIGLLPSPQLGNFPIHVIPSSLGRRNMNFLPDDYQEILIKISRLKKTIKILSLILIFAISFSVVFAVRFGKKNHQVSLLKTRLRDIEKETASIKVLHRRIRATENVLQNQTATLESLANIVPLIKRSMRLSSFSLDRDNTVEISGHADTFKDVLEFMRSLQQISAFENVRSEYISQKKLLGKDVFTFKIVLNYIPGKAEDKSE